MKTNQELYSERTERLKKVLNLDKPDRTPVIYMADAFCAVHMGEKVSSLVSSLKNASKIILKSYQKLGDVDGTNFPFSPGPLFPMSFYSNVKLPGRELPDNSLWQLDEKEVMTVEDYDMILSKGWEDFSVEYLKKRLNFPFEDVIKELGEIPSLIQNFADAGYLVYSPFAPSVVTEFLAGGRSMPKFMRDLYKIPDKVEAVLDVIQEAEMNILRQQLRAVKPLVVFMSPARGASEFYAPKLWQRFIWKYLKQTADVIIEEGAVANIHADGNWERDLDFFRSFPKGKIVFECDGGTNIYKIKEVLGDRACIKGDVPAAKLTLESPEHVYNYCTKLIRDMGSGFILSSGCTVPLNAKVDNVKAMILAATGK